MESCFDLVLAWEAEVLARVFVTNIAHERSDQCIVVGELARFEVAADEVAEREAEILVPWITHERARVGDHANEAREQAEIGKRIELPLPRLLLIEESPAAAH